MIDQKKFDYIKAALSQRKSREEIYKDLLIQGVSLEVIEENFAAVVKEQAKPTKEETQKKTVQIILIAGAVLVAAGIFSFIASHWQHFSRFGKIMWILVALLTVYGLGWYLETKKGYARTAHTLYFLGTLIYGAGIFLVAQIFNIRANWPDGFILWMLGALAMGFALESWALMILVFPLALTALIGHPMGLYGGMARYNPFLFTSTSLLFVAAVVLFIAGWVIFRKIPHTPQDQSSP